MTERQALDAMIANDVLLARDLEYVLRKPCGDCPFLKTTPYHEGVAAKVPEVMQSVQDQRAMHTCHKTDNRPTCDGPRNHAGRPQACVGFVLMLLKTGKSLDLQLPLLQAAEQGKLDIAAWVQAAKAAKDVYTVVGFLQFYADEIWARIPVHVKRRERAKARRKKQGRRR